MTVTELRAQLDALEQGWSDDDRQVLGEFGAQWIHVDVIGPDGKFAGIGTPEPASYDACSGVMLMANYNNERRRADANA